MLFLIGLGFAADLLVYHLPRRAYGSIAFIPFLSAVLIAPTWITVAAVGLAKLVAEAIHKRRPVKAAFNVAQTCLAAGVGTLSFLALGGVPLRNFSADTLLHSTSADFLAYAVMFGASFLVSSLTVSGVIGISEGRSPLEIWRQNTMSTLAYDTFSGPIIYLFAWAFVKWGSLGAAGLALPLLGLRQLHLTNLQLEQVNKDLLELMVRAIEARDPYTSGHSRRVQHYAMIIARAIGLTGKQVERIGFAALLHDVGKIHEVYAPILRKPEKLTPEERAVMRTHSTKSAELVATVSTLKDLVHPVRHHHENWDGSGYPDGLAGTEIPLASRIIMFADTIDAMTSDRPYRKALTQTQVRDELAKFRGKQFDPGICDQLLASPMFSALFLPAQRDPTPAANRRVVLSRALRSGLTT
ncbi:MAG TPA: HD-GYP domain-containing protein [Gemmatimonadaceae bacterium]|nr:HD-GYP domain-containing protein [Gemmatimonadaceae bacterium]